MSQPRLPVGRRGGFFGNGAAEIGEVKVGEADFIVVVGIGVGLVWSL